MSFIIRGTNAPQKQDIYIISKTRHLFLHELYSISSKPSKTETFEDLVFKGSEETET